MGLKKLVMCIPTYNSPLIIEDTLNIISEKLKYINVDVYICDSSTNEETKNIVDKWKDKFSNIKYKKYPSDMPSNMKVYNIFKEFSKNQQYDYIWLIRDYTTYNNEQIDIIMSKLVFDYDIIVVRKYSYNQLEKKEYTDKNTFFTDNFYALSMYGAAVLNINTILKNVDWNYLEIKYMNHKCINLSHEALYFEQISRLNSFKAVNLGIMQFETRRSKYKTNSAWINDSIRIWSECWVETILSLPDIYNEGKTSVIKGNFDNPFSVDKLLECRKKCAYGIKLFLKYRKWIYQVDSNCKKKYLLIAILPKCLVNIVADLIESYRVKKFYKMYNTIAIYGAGLYGKIYSSFLKKHNLKFDYFLVTQKRTGNNMLMNHNIISISDISFDEAKVGIIVALGYFDRMEVVNYLEGQGYKNTIYIPSMTVALENKEK